MRGSVPARGKLDGSSARETPAAGRDSLDLGRGGYHPVVLENLSRDIARYGRGRSRVAWLLSHGAWASVGYRFARWEHTCGLPSALRLPLRALAVLLQLVVRTLTAIELPASCSIGAGLHIPHSGYVVLGAGTEVGENVTFCPGVVLGHSLGGERGSAGTPRLGSRVYVGPGAKLIGPIEIGEDALIGAGAVVTRPVPARGVAVGNPARVTSERGSFDVVAAYPGMETDPERLASLARIPDAKAT